MILLNVDFYFYKVNFPETVLNNLNVSPYSKLFDFVKLTNALNALYSSHELKINLCMNYYHTPIIITI